MPGQGMVGPDAPSIIERNSFRSLYESPSTEIVTGIKRELRVSHTFTTSTIEVGLRDNTSARRSPPSVQRDVEAPGKKSKELPDPNDKDIPTLDVQNIDNINEVKVMFLSREFAPMTTGAEMVKA